MACFGSGRLHHPAAAPEYRQPSNTPRRFREESEWRPESAAATSQAGPNAIDLSLLHFAQDIHRWRVNPPCTVNVLGLVLGEDIATSMLQEMVNTPDGGFRSLSIHETRWNTTTNRSGRGFIHGDGQL